MKHKEESGIRYKLKYRDENLYVVITDTSLDLSMVDIDDQNTLTELDIIANLVTLCLENNIDKEKIASSIWSVSRNEKDLAAKLSEVITSVISS